MHLGSCQILTEIYNTFAWFLRPLATGNCGSGPNVVLCPSGMVVMHVSTPSHLVEVLSDVAKLPVLEDILMATQVGAVLSYFYTLWALPTERARFC